MCVICHHSPCASSCPNAPEPEPVEMCVECRGGIYAGDRFWDGPKGPVCEDCLNDMSGKEVLELLGEAMQEAEEKEYEW